jgi:predicted heme/steroid binding protein/uncharacterized membrane protein
LSEEKHFTVEELAAYNGQDGKPVFIAYKDRVIDVTGSSLWLNGLHMMRHHAGKDLTDEFKDAPHNLDVLDRYPQVGILKKEEMKVTAKRKIPRILTWIFDHYPLLKRHPHPFIVHFPVVLLVLSPLFTALYLITGARSFEITSFHCLAVGLLFTLAAIPSGLLTWWANYSAHFFKQVIIKIILSPILFVTGLIVFFWRFKNPLILEHVASYDFVYLFLLFLLAPLVLTIGWFGATMTFPIHRD